MQIQISVRDDKAELFLQILNEFKNDMIEKFQVLKSSYLEDIEQKELEEDYKNRTALDNEIAFSKIVQIEV